MGHGGAMRAAGPGDASFVSMTYSKPIPMVNRSPGFSRDGALLPYPSRYNAHMRKQSDILCLNLLLYCLYMEQTSTEWSNL